MDDAKLARSLTHDQSLLSLGRTTDPSSTMTESMVSVSSNNSSETITSKSSNLTMNEHKIHIIDTLDKWWDSNKSKFNLSEFSLIESQHYFISIVNDQSSTLKGKMKCCCETWLSLSVGHGKFKISKLHRHLQDVRNGITCNTMKGIINSRQLTLSTTIDDQQLFRAPDTVPNKASSLPNLVPSTPISVTMSSDSTFFTSSSISISTDDHKSIEKP